MNTKIERVDFSLAYIQNNFTYSALTGVIREKATGSKIGNINTGDGGTRVTHNGKTVSGARIAWMLSTGKDIAPGYAITLRQRTPGHYGNRLNNLYMVDVLKDPNYFE